MELYYFYAHIHEIPERYAPKIKQTDISAWWRIIVVHHYTQNMGHEKHLDNTTHLPLFLQNVHLRGKSKPYQIWHMPIMTYNTFDHFWISWIRYFVLGFKAPLEVPSNIFCLYVERCVFIHTWNLRIDPKHTRSIHRFPTHWFQGPLLLTWFNFNPSMDK